MSLDDKILDLFAGGMAVRDITAQLGELYGVDISRDTISRVTDAVLEDVAEWLAAARTRLSDRLL
jgi:putative transposase